MSTIGAWSEVSSVMQVAVSVALVVMLFDVALFCAGVTLFEAAGRKRGWLKGVIGWGSASCLAVVLGQWLGHPLAPILGVVAAFVVAGADWMIRPLDRWRRSRTHPNADAAAEESVSFPRWLS